jgi:tetratricopeptide (TPR) repeat protein
MRLRATRRLAAAIVFAACAWCSEAPAFDQGVTLYRDGQLAAALQQFDASEKSGEKAAERPLYQGMCLAKQNEWLRAAHYLVPYSQAFPGDDRGWYWLAQVQLYQKQFADAKASIQRSIERNRTSSSAFRSLGKIDLELKDYDGAYRAWIEANRLDPKDSRTTYYLGRLFYEADFPNEAAAWLRETLRLQPRHYAAMTYLALCAERLNMKKTARELYVAAIRESRQQGKPFSWAYLNYAKLLREDGRELDAVATLEEAVKLCPEAHVLAELGKLLSSANQPARAAEILRRSIALDPSIPDAHYRLAILLRAEGKTAESAAEMQEFLAARDAAERNKVIIQAIRKDK